MTKVISFSSGKGGVGKTSLVANLGSLLAKRGQRVLMIDGDWSLGKLGITLGVRPEWNVEQVLQGQITLNDALSSIKPGLHLLSSPSGSLGFEELTESDRHKLFYELDMLSGEFDFILFDHSSGLGGDVTQFAAASHRQIIVTTAEPTSYTDAYAIMKILSKRYGVKDFSVIATMSHNRRETEGIMDRFLDVAHSHLGVRATLLQILALEPKVSEAIRRQRAFVELYPSADLTDQLNQVCDNLEVVACVPSHGLSFFYGANANPLAAR